MKPGVVVQLLSSVGTVTALIATQMKDRTGAML